MHEEVKGPAAHHSRASSFVTLLSGWVQQGVESLFATQRIMVDLALRQNAGMMKSMRESMSDPKNSPTAILTEMAVEGTANFVEAQRILLDLVQKENEIFMGGVKERVGGSAPALAMTELLRRSVDTFVDMQHEFLTIASKHAQGWMQEAQEGKIYNGSHLVDMAREAMDNFVGAQKKFLDVVSQETDRVTTGKHLPPSKQTKTELTKLAREAANSFIDAQKKLLDLAGQEMNVNLQAATRAMDMLTPSRLMPLANLTGEGVKNFVDAEKELIDSMMKRNGAGKSAPKVHRPKRAARAKKTQAAHVGD